MFYKKYIKFQFILCLVFVPIIIIGQSEGKDLSPEEQQIAEADMHLIFRGLGDSIVLKWTPMNPEDWEKTIPHGYRITRRDVDPNGNIINDSEVILIGNNYADQVKQKSESWFRQNSTVEDSLAGMMGNLLYSPNMKIGFEGKDNIEDRFKTAIVTSEQSDFINESLGWYWVDRTTKEDAAYEYSIQSFDATGQLILGDQLIIENEMGAYEAPPAFSLNPLLTDENYFQTELRLDQIVMSAKPMGDKIILRWAPNSPKFWKECNLDGYIINRVTINPETGRIADNPEVKIFVDTVANNLIMPWDSTRFLANPIESDSMVMVAAQTLYGKSMNLKKGNFIDQNSDLENRFTFAMLAAERSAKAAEVLGLRWVDDSVEPGKIYRYQIASPADPMMISLYSVYVENKKEEAETPYFFEAAPGDKAILLSWSKDYNRRKFSTYRIERSDDNGQTFKKLNAEPLLYIDKKNSENLTYNFIDSVDQNDKTYLYRLYGLNTFAEWSPPAELSAKAEDQTPPPNPLILSVVEQSTGIVNIAWDIKNEPADIKGYKVLMGEKDDALFSPISENLLPPGSNEYIYKVDSLRTDIAYYFKVAAFDQKDNESLSYPYFLNVVDSIAPAPPVELIGVIDTLGIVTIGWKMGEEQDLAGYRVYFGNREDYEFTQLTVSPIETNYFLDTIELKTLTEDIFYKVQSVDGRHNRSEFSEVLKLEKPDILPPAIPLLRQPRVSADSIVLNWVPSISEDVEKHILYRRKFKSEIDWVELSTLGPKDSLFTDISAETEQIYEYRIRAQDDAGLFSEYSFIQKGRKWFDGKIIAVQNLQLTQDTTSKKHIKVIWEFEEPTAKILQDVDYRFYLYRSKGNDPLTRHKQFKSDIRAYVDTNVSQKTQYNYAMKVVFVNGKTSPISEMVSMEK